MNSISKSDIDKKFGKVFKKFRLKNNLTQEQFAEKIGISLKYVSRIETGNSGIKTSTLIKYMNVLGITPNTIYAPFIKHADVAKNVEISEKLCDLSDEKKDFINSMIDLLKRL